jgi:outer membrane protein, heavy metal efflux system
MRRPIGLLVLALAAVGLLPAVRGTPADLPERASMEEMLRFAAANNPAMRAAYEEWQAAAARVGGAGALPDPQINYSYFVRRMDTQQVFSLSQMVPGFGKRAGRTGVAEQRALAAGQRFEAERLSVFATVERTLAEFAYTSAVVDIVRRNHELVRQFEEVALARLRSGAASDADVLRLQMEGDRLEDEISTMTEMLEPAAAMLNAALGRPAGAPLPSVPLETVEVPADARREAGTWVQGHPELRAAEFEVQAAEEGVRLARRAAAPDLMVGLEYMDNRMNRDEVAVMAGITLPIWRQKNRSERQEAQAMHRFAQARQENVGRELEAEARQVQFRLRDAERKMVLYRDRLLPRARQTVESLGRGYRAGSVDFIDWIDAQRMLLDVEMNYLQAIADQRRSVADLRKLTGENLRRIAPVADSTRR